MRSDRSRLDELVTRKGLASNRNVARGLILAGRVEVNGRVVDKAGTVIPVGAGVVVRQGPRFVSRGGEKLAGALSTFNVVVEGRLALDVGASTGGFVDCLLQHNVARVIAVDVGHGQLDARLRGDPRVAVMDGVNARYLRGEDLPYRPDFLTVDVSFISVRKILGPVVGCMNEYFEGLLLIKPQFEAGRSQVGKKGIIRDAVVHRTVLVEIAGFLLNEARLEVYGVSPSGLRGVRGNREFFYHVGRARGNAVRLDRLEEMVERCVTSKGQEERLCD